MSALCKVNGRLVLMSTTTPDDNRHGKCPCCKGFTFRDAPHGWVECENDECDFAVLKRHFERLPDDVASIIGANI